MARRFGHTWWGRAWTSALEDRASLDPNRLPRGRTYARQERVGRLTTEPGSIHASVRGRRAQPYRVDVRFRTFTDAEWDVVVDQIVAKAARTAALLDGELDPGLVDDAVDSGVSLLPRAGELQPRCTCPDWADPCKHSAAVCYLVADELDADPFALLLLRGRSRDDVLAAVRRRRAGPPSPGSERSGHRSAPAVIRATEAWSRNAGRMPEVPHPRPRPGSVATWPIDPPPNAPFERVGADRDSRRRRRPDVACDHRRRVAGPRPDGGPGPRPSRRRDHRHGRAGSAGAPDREHATGACPPGDRLARGRSLGPRRTRRTPLAPRPTRHGHRSRRRGRRQPRAGPRARQPPSRRRCPTAPVSRRSLVPVRQARQHLGARRRTGRRARRPRLTPPPCRTSSLALLHHARGGSSALPVPSKRSREPSDDRRYADAGRHEESDDRPPDPGVSQRRARGRGVPGRRRVRPPRPARHRGVGRPLRAVQAGAPRAHRRARVARARRRGRARRAPAPEARPLRLPPVPVRARAATSTPNGASWTRPRSMRSSTRGG